MRLELEIIPKSNSRVANRREFFFAVIDLDRAESYPMNFVCVLPKLNSNTKVKSTFLVKFGDKSFQVAKKLLTKALVKEETLVIRTEIEQRLQALQGKTVKKVKCICCKKMFEPKSFGRYKQKKCQACKNKPVK